jgi:arylformamidase
MNIAAKGNSDRIKELVAFLGHFNVVDLSPVLSSNMPKWWTHPDLAIVTNARNFEQHGYFLQTLYLPEHIGCHVDAPSHGLRDHPEQSIDSYKPLVISGIAKKADVSSRDWKPGELLSLADFQKEAELKGYEVEKDDIVFVDFGWDKYLIEADQNHEVGEWWGSNTPGFEEDLCRYLRDVGVKAVGTDTVSADIASINGEVTSAFGHEKYFLPNNILILEGVFNLRLVPSIFYFLALPLKIKDGSGSPLRPIALVPA